MQLGNGHWEKTIFNSRLQPTTIALGVTQSATNLLKLDYSYGTTQNNGNIQSQTITVPNGGSNTVFTQNYVYDQLNRLKEAVETVPNQTGWQQTFDYDRYGNRRFDTTQNRTTTLPSNCPTAVCNPEVSTANNRLVGTTFDNAGNTKLDAEGRTFIYDGENKQVEVWDGSV